MVGLQIQIDELLAEVESSANLKKDAHITGNVFQIIENTPKFLKRYKELCGLHTKPDPVNNMIGKRVRQIWKQTKGKAVSAKGKTSLAKTYSLLD
jgi:hypothetical protein